MFQNLHQRFDRYYIGQIYGGDFAKCCGLLRIYEFYKLACYDVSYTSGSGFKNHGFHFDIFNFQSSILLHFQVISNQKEKQFP